MFCIFAFALTTAILLVLLHCGKDIVLIIILYIRGRAEIFWGAACFLHRPFKMVDNLSERRSFNYKRLNLYNRGKATKFGGQQTSYKDF